MIVTVEIPENYAKVLSEWASVSRTLRTAEEGCEEARDKGDERLTDKFQHCAQELEALIPALDFLHQAVRNELWKSQRS